MTKTLDTSIEFQKGKYYFFFIRKNICYRKKRYVIIKIKGIIIGISTMFLIVLDGKNKEHFIYKNFIQRVLFFENIIDRIINNEKNIIPQEIISVINSYI